MKTTIIPQIKDIDVKTTPLHLSDFYPDDQVLRVFPRAAEIFDGDSLGETYPISYIPSPLSEGEYRIIARADRIEISAAGGRGLMYGLFTLSELSRVNDGELTEFDAFDKPSLEFRALSDDISRGQISTLENFFSILRRLARYKYSCYLPYMEDVFRFESVPAWGRYSGGMGREEWKAIIDYAKSYYIEVRPIVNLLGHFEKLCRIEELQPLALRKKDGTITDVMDPKKPEVRPLLAKMIRELAQCFGPGPVHCGGDEPAALTEVYGRQEGGRLFLDHYAFVARELAKYDCTLILYADFFDPTGGDYGLSPARAAEVPEDTRLVFWDYDAKDSYPALEALHQQELPVYLSPGSWGWQRFSCDLHNCYDNIKSLLKADGGRASGMILACWSDEAALRELFWPGILMGANFCWSPHSSYEYTECMTLLHKSYYGFDEASAELLEPVYHYDRILRRRDAFEFSREMFRSPFELPEFRDWENIPILQAALRKAGADLASLSPKRNHAGFEALELTIARAAFTAKKIASLPHGPLRTQEQVIPYGQKALELAAELPVLKELHRRLWFETGRNAQWDQCAALYDDLYDELQMFARRCRLRSFFTQEPLPKKPAGFRL